MPLGGRVPSNSSSLQIPAQPRSAAFRIRHSEDHIQLSLVRAIINLERGMEEPFQSHTPQPPGTCGSPGPAGRFCSNVDVRVAVLLVTLAGAVILLLLYKLLQLRHRLRLARARHALEYYSLFHTATYTLKHPTPCQDPPVKNGSSREASPPVPTAVTIATPAILVPEPPLPSHPPSPIPLPPPPVPPAPPAFPPTPIVSQVLSLPLPMPLIHTTPPSPHLSWGACSDADVYSRIGAFRPSRLSSLSSQSTVILFEHSSL